MAIRRRNSFPGLSPGATRELIAFQDDLLAELASLRVEAIGSTTDSKQAAYSARFNERIRCVAGAAGLAITFPGATTQTQNRWIEILKIGGGDVRITALSGTVQGVTTLTLTANGFYYFQSDGAGGWWIQPTTGGGGGGEDLAATLVIGNTTGPTSISVTAGQRLIFNGGGGAPDIQGTASLTATAATSVAFTAGTTMLCTGTGNASLQSSGAVASVVGSTGVLCATVGGNVTCQVGGVNSFRVLTNAVERLEILGTGEWQVSNVAGALGNVLTHQGPGVPPLWVAPAAGSALTLLTTEVNLGALPTYSGTFTIAGVGMTIGKPVLIQQAVGPYTGKGTLADEAEDQVSAVASVTSAVAITAYWSAQKSPIVGNVKFNYAVSA